MPAPQPPPPSTNPPLDAPGPGPSARDFKRNPERAYTGPRPEDIGKLGPRAGASSAEAERYFARLPEALEPPMPRFAKWMTVGGWVVGGAACAYMVLVADFGKQEHVFSPIRRAFQRYTSDLFTLSQTERGMLGLEDKASSPAGTLSTLQATKAEVAAAQAEAKAKTRAEAKAAVPPTLEEPAPSGGRKWYRAWLW